MYQHLTKEERIIAVKCIKKFSELTNVSLEDLKLFVKHTIHNEEPVISIIEEAQTTNYGYTVSI